MIDDPNETTNLPDFNHMEPKYFRLNVSPTAHISIINVEFSTVLTVSNSPAVFPL